MFSYIHKVSFSMEAQMFSKVFQKYKKTSVFFVAFCVFFFPTAHLFLNPERFIFVFPKKEKKNSQVTKANVFQISSAVNQYLPDFCGRKNEHNCSRLPTLFSLADFPASSTRPNLSHISSRSLRRLIHQT